MVGGFHDSSQVSSHFAPASLLVSSSHVPKIRASDWSIGAKMIPGVRCLTPRRSNYFTAVLSLLSESITSSGDHNSAPKWSETSPCPQSNYLRQNKGMVFDREAETGARAALCPRLRDLKSGGWLLDSQVRLQGLGEGQRRYLHKQLQGDHKRRTLSKCLLNR